MTMTSPVAHVPGVFSHYSPRTGSALITKVHAHARALEAGGGTAYILVNRARDVGYEEGTPIRFSSPREGRAEWFTTADRRIDSLAAKVIGRRPRTARFYRPVLDAVPSDAQAVVIYNQPAALTSSFARRFEGLKVLHLGNDVFRSWSPVHIQRALDNFDLTVAVSEFTAGAINSRLRGGRRRVKVLRNGVDIHKFHPAELPPTGVPEILFVGNMIEAKGAHYLLRAALVLATEGLSFRLRIVGSWGLGKWDTLTDYEKSLRALAAPLGSRVTFQPFVDRDSIADVYRGASIFCMPVDWDEPAGQVVTEAMASGLATVAASRGGIPEYLGPEGRYADPSRPQVLAGELRRFLENPEERLLAGGANRQRAEGMSWQVRATEFDLMLRKVAARDS